MILAYRLGDNGMISVVNTRNPHVYLMNVAQWSPIPHEMVAVIRAPAPWLQTFKARFSDRHVPERADWFLETPEMLAYLEGSAIRDRPPRDRRKRLNDQEAREIFRLAHDAARLNDETIGDRYGVSKITVGQIARGQSHKHLFGRREAPEAVPGSYWVYEIAEPSRQHLLRFGERKR